MRCTEPDPVYRSFLGNRFGSRGNAGNRRTYSGIVGMFLAIPILAIFKIIFDNVDGMRPYGFVLGEDNAPTPLFEKYYDRYFYRKKPSDNVLPKALQTEEQNRNEGADTDEETTSKEK